MNRLLLRQFIGRSSGATCLLLIAIWFLKPGPKVIFGALVGGGWMVSNGAALAWMGSKALQHSQHHPERYVAGFLMVVLGSLALGAWLVAVLRPSLPGLSMGCAVPLALFIFQLRQLKLTFHPDAR